MDGTWGRELSQDCVVFVKVHFRFCSDLFIATVYFISWFFWCVGHVDELVGELIGVLLMLCFFDITC